ncbi:unnamed protein product [Lathyrus sativus]|nr:unnamed protein product [Lathyrus sativus]
MGSSRGRGRPKKTVSPPPKQIITQTTQPECSQDNDETNAKQQSQDMEAQLGTKEQSVTGDKGKTLEPTDSTYAQEPKE